MKILAIDTSASFCSACIYCAETSQTLAEMCSDIGRGHAEVLMAHVEDCFKQANMTMQDIEQIAVTLGPGSFTGVRVGLAAAKGMALGLGVPIIGVSTLQAAIFEARRGDPETRVAAILDARRDQAFFQIADGEPSIGSWQQVAELLRGFDGELCGSGAEQVNQLLEQTLPVTHTNTSANIECVALCSLEKNVGNQTIEPIYLRSADAKKQAGAALPRK